MERRNIDKIVLDKVLSELSDNIIKMLPDKPINLLKYATRVKEIKFSEGIDDSTKSLMREKWLSDEEYLKTFFYVMAITFYNKKSVKNPVINIVTAQTGSGKSNLTAKLLREDENYIFVDSDKYKHFRYDAKDISKNYPLLYAHLTGPDAYDHAFNIYNYAVDNKYNIIKETAPSKNKGLLEINENELKSKGYKINVQVLAVGKLNSLLSMHERYELQIIYGLKTAKLTGILRHNESYDALIPNINDIMRNKCIDKINVYKRGNIYNDYEPIIINTDDVISTINIARQEDNNYTKKVFLDRYNLIMKQMKNRNALDKQIKQLESIKEYFLKFED